MALFGLLLMSTLSVQAQVARVAAPISPVTPIAASAKAAPADAAAQVEQWRQALDAGSWTPDLHRDGNAKGNLPVGGFACGALGAKSKRIVLDFPDSGGLHTVRQYRGDASKFCTPDGIGKITFTDGSTWYGQVGNRAGLWNRVLPYPDGLGELSGGDQDHVLMIARPDEAKAWGWYVERELFNYSAYQARLEYEAEQSRRRAAAEYERRAAEQVAQERARVEQAAQAAANTPAKRLSTLCPDGHDCDVID